MYGLSASTSRVWPSSGSHYLGAVAPPTLKRSAVKLLPLGDAGGQNAMSADGAPLPGEADGWDAAEAGESGREPVRGDSRARPTPKRAADLNAWT